MSFVWLKNLLFLLTLASFTLPVAAAAEVLTADTVWQGEVVLEDDLYIPRGITLTVAAGTTVRIRPAESTKIDPEYLSPLTEIVLRGHMEVEGEAEQPVRFVLEGEAGAEERWAGIQVDAGNLWLRHAVIQGAETAVNVSRGWVKLKHSELTGNRYGLVVQGPQSGAKLEKSRIGGNDYGLLALDGATLEREESTIADNAKEDELQEDFPAQPPPAAPLPPVSEPQLSRVYTNESLIGTTVWEGKIQVNGVVRLPMDSRLVILPGTVVEFSKRDTNGDNIGENGLLLQGVFIAKGTAEKPITFRSAEKEPDYGDWDAINILGSDGTQNLIEHCRIENAYRGMHFHFANVGVRHTRLLGNYRGIQFQESLVAIEHTEFINNKSAIQARDSEIRFTDNLITGNLNGANFFRVNMEARRNRFLANGKDGIRIREGSVTFAENASSRNRYGLQVADVVYGRFHGNLLNHNHEFGATIRNCDNFELSGNLVQYNSLNGINITDSRGTITNNQVTDNRRRGFGIITFAGTISGNTIVANGLHAMEVEGTEEVAAPDNWWGPGPLEAERIIDWEDDAGRGQVRTEPVRKNAPPFVWPLAAVYGPAAMHGEVLVKEQVSFESGSKLVVSPGTRVLFGDGAGLLILGSLRAEGTAEKRISFTADQETDAGYWGEVALERAVDSVVSYADFSKADWGLHVHFTQLVVSHSRFFDNYGGLRFRSGPVTLENNLFRNNDIGIRAYEGRAEIRGNVFTGNDTGIFVREGGNGLVVRGNDITANRRWNIRVGDFTVQDVDAAENWWGTADPSDSIFDRAEEPGVGQVHFEPVRESPVHPELLEENEGALP